MPNCVIFKNISGATKKSEEQFEKKNGDGGQKDTDKLAQTDTGVGRHRQTQTDTD